MKTNLEEILSNKNEMEYLRNSYETDITCALYLIRTGYPCRETGDVCHNCWEETLKWLSEENKRQAIKLTQFEIDLICSVNSTESEGLEFRDVPLLISMKEKGYFQGVIDVSVDLRAVLQFYEVVESENV